MKPAHNLVILACVALLGGALPSVAQYGSEHQMDPLPSGGSGLSAPSRKSSPLFKRPKKRDAASQLEHARGLMKDEKFGAAAAQFLALVRTWPESEQAGQAQWSYADALEQDKDYTKAFQEYQYLIDFYSTGYSFTNVLDRQFAIANHVMTKKSSSFAGMGGNAHPVKALWMFEQLVDNAPNWVRTPEVYYLTGLIHEQDKQFIQAMDAYTTVQDRFPTSRFAPDAAFREAEVSYEVAKKNRRDEASFQRALASITQLMRRYPEYHELDKAKEMQQEIRETLMNMYYDRADFYDRISGKPESAIIMYEDLIRNFPLSDRAAKARERVKELKQNNGDSGQ